MSRSSGLALVSVLAGVAILSLIAAVMLSTLRVAAGAARGDTIALQARTIAEAALARTVLALTDGRADHRPRVDAVPATIEIDGSAVEVTVQDEFGKLDLNQADGSVLAALFRNAGLDAASATSLADKVLDWREAGPGRHLNGATADDYQAAGYAYAPRRGPFQTVDELGLVMAMTPELLAQVQPALTVYTGRPGINAATAPPEALMVLPGFDAQRAADQVAQRLRGTAIGSGPVTDGRVDPAIPLAGWPFTIRTRLMIRDRSFERETVLRLTADPARPFWVMAERGR